MGYIKCEYHGGNVTSLVSEYHADKANKKEECIVSEILRIQVTDQQGLFNGNYIADPTLIEDIGIEGMKINFQTDQDKFESMFESLVPVCTVCLNDYLNKK